MRLHIFHTREGGHRVPAMAYWKGRIEPGTSDELLIGMDMFPTFAALAGWDLPDGIELDGADFSSLLLENESLEERPVYWRFRGERTVRIGPWKLLVLKDSTYLFNLLDDPSEKVNTIQRYPDLSDSLKQLLQAWEEDMDTFKLNTF